MWKFLKELPEGTPIVIGDIRPAVGYLDPCDPFARRLAAAYAAGYRYIQLN